VPTDARVAIVNAKPLRDGIDWSFHARHEPVDIEAIPAGAHEQNDNWEGWPLMPAQRVRHDRDLPACPSRTGQWVLATVADGCDV
jgi:hypothetical protein